jgi:hypothetical protein
MLGWSAANIIHSSKQESIIYSLQVSLSGAGSSSSSISSFCFALRWTRLTFDVCMLSPHSAEWRSAVHHAQNIVLRDTRRPAVHTHWLLRGLLLQDLICSAAQRSVTLHV